MAEPNASFVYAMVIIAGLIAFASIITSGIALAEDDENIVRVTVDGGFNQVNIDSVDVGISSKSNRTLGLSSGSGISITSVGSNIIQISELTPEFERLTVVKEGKGVCIITASICSNFDLVSGVGMSLTGSGCSVDFSVSDQLTHVTKVGTLLGLSVKGTLSVDGNITAGSPESHLTIGENSATLGGLCNTVSTGSSHSVVAGGVSNIISNSQMAFIAGGFDNSVSGTSSAVVAGSGNTIFSGATHSFIGGGDGCGVSGKRSGIVGGQGNNIRSGATHSFIGGGFENSINSGATYSFMGGGFENSIFSDATHSFIGGGDGCGVSGERSGIVGGQGNNIRSGVTHSFIGGGEGMRCFW